MADYVYFWGSYATGGTSQYNTPQVLSIIGTGRGGSAVSMVDADASFAGYVAGALAYGIGTNAGNEIGSGTVPNPVTTPTKIGATSTAGAGFSWPHPPIFTKGG